jgi:hypothetical protein
MKFLLVVSAFLTVAAVLYLIPTGIEYFMAERHISVWLSAVILGDLVGCGILYLLGFRRLAVKIYAVSIPVKAVLVLVMGEKSPVLWLTDVIPALVAATIVSRAVVRMLVTLPRDFDSGF